MRRLCSEGVPPRPGFIVHVIEFGRPETHASTWPDNGGMSRHKRLWAVVLFVGLLLAVLEVSGLRDHFSLAFLHQQFIEHEVSGMVIFILLYSLGNLIQIPGWIFLAAAVLALGQTWGGVATYVAASISCVCTFVVVRLLGGDALRQLDGKLVARIFSQLDAHPLKSVVLLRLLMQSLPALNYALALSGVKFRSYLIGTLLGLPLPIALYCIFFDTLAKVLHLQTF